MSQTFTSPAQALNALRAMLPKVPSPGFGLMLNDVFAIGLPLHLGKAAKSVTGHARVSREGILLQLADVTLNEGVIAHELAHVLLETRGWPRLVPQGDNGDWAVRALRTLVSLIDHACGIALQRAYGVDGSAYEADLLEPTEQRASKLMRQAHLLPTLNLSGEQKAEFATGLALASVEQYWRRGRVPDNFMRALDLLPGAQELYLGLTDYVPEEGPSTGWQVRRLAAQMIGHIDEFAENLCRRRPLGPTSRFVPGMHATDTSRPAGEVAHFALHAAPQGGFDVQVINRRDGLSFTYHEAAGSEAAVLPAVKVASAEAFAPFCRARIPKEILIWQPSGTADDQVL